MKTTGQQSNDVCLTKVEEMSRGYSKGRLATKDHQKDGSEQDHSHRKQERSTSHRKE